MKWEYVILEQPEDTEEGAWLCEQGQAGWELIQRADYLSSRWKPPVYYFKRVCEINPKLRKIQLGEDTQCNENNLKPTE